ncbi:MAG: hypothetical protein AB7V62_05815 [Thermoleophilia bacterium]
MGKIYRADPVKAVRGQGFITILHGYLISELRRRLSPEAHRRGITVRPEVTILGSHKPKDVDLAVMHPDNGPLVMIGVRSQMSSVGKNALNYYEGIVGECISIQDRFPMSTIGYVYLMPLKPIKLGREKETIDHRRYARMYDAVTGRTGQDYKNIRGVYDEFAYMVVDFTTHPPELADHVYKGAVDHDLSISTFADRLVATFKARMLFWDIFL